MSVGDPIDLAALRAMAEDETKDRTTVSRAWLGRVLAELTAGRDAADALGRVFGLSGQKI